MVKMRARSVSTQAVKTVVVNMKNNISTDISDGDATYLLRINPQKV
jgi:hypothetical protein